MHGGTAGDDVNLGTGCKDIVGDLIIGKIGQSLVQAGEYGVPQRLRLFVDLLQHEMWKSVFHGGIHVPVDFHQFGHLFVAVEIVEMDFIGGQTHDVIFRDDKVLPRIGNERR